MVIFRLHGQKPPLYRLEPKFAWWVASPMYSRVQSFKLKFLGVTILQGGGSNFPFSYWFLHGPYNSAARLRCLWCRSEWQAWSLRCSFIGICVSCLRSYYVRWDFIYCIIIYSMCAYITYFYVQYNTHVLRHFKRRRALSSYTLCLKKVPTLNSCNFVKS